MIFCTLKLTDNLVGGDISYIADVYLQSVTWIHEKTTRINMMILIKYPIPLHFQTQHLLITHHFYFDKQVQNCQTANKKNHVEHIQ